MPEICSRAHLHQRQLKLRQIFPSTGFLRSMRHLGLIQQRNINLESGHVKKGKSIAIASSIFTLIKRGYDLDLEKPQL
jgi:hypothetical protein